MPIKHIQYQPNIYRICILHFEYKLYGLILRHIVSLEYFLHTSTAIKMYNSPATESTWLLNLINCLPLLVNLGPSMNRIVEFLADWVALV